MCDERKSEKKLDRWQREVIDYVNRFPKENSNKKSCTKSFKTELDEAIDDFNQNVSSSMETLSVFKELDVLFERSSKLKEGEILEIKI